MIVNEIDIIKIAINSSENLSKEKRDECIEYINNLQQENEKLKAELELYKGTLQREHEAIHRANDLETKLNKAIELLIKENLPCDIENFNIRNADYCSSNCSVDEEVFKKCWLKYIEQELEK